MNKTIKKIIIGVVVIAFISIVASFFINRDSNTSGNALQSTTTGGTGAPLTQNATTNPNLLNTENINREFVSMLLNLQSITLNDDIFSEPAFKALVDNTVRLNQPGNQGRPNPFAPIGTDSISGGVNLNASASSALPSSQNLNNSSDSLNLSTNNNEQIENPIIPPIDSN